MDNRKTMNSHKLWCLPKCRLHCLITPLYTIIVSYTIFALSICSNWSIKQNKFQPAEQALFFRVLQASKGIREVSKKCHMHNGGKTFFFYALPCHTCLVFLTWLKSENKRHFMQAISRKQKVQINETVSILAKELTIFFHYKLKLKSQPFSVFDQVFLTL